MGPTVQLVQILSIKFRIPRYVSREANFSKAEKALQHGCSDPNRLNIPKVSDGLDMVGMVFFFLYFYV